MPVYSAQWFAEQFHVEQPPIAAALFDATQQFLTDRQLGMQLGLDLKFLSSGAHHAGDFLEIHLDLTVGEHGSNHTLDGIAAGGVGILLITW